MNFKIYVWKFGKELPFGYCFASLEQNAQAATCGASCQSHIVVSSFSHIALKVELGFAWMCNNRFTENLGWPRLSFLLQQPR
ncbi:hypothetical protein CIPAW_03G106400 [Carya illinoinensis]|uniref:Uncharacterized protein n=1 Tax=Carya illinoinensis TaxID=32201 RepID=A0A8T1R1Q3_CARIL|nr:hypothetical protein CIPAW_03G106400 [Carya illinoinensis]